MTVILLCDNFTVQCGHCMFFRVNADLDNKKSICKRIDHKHIQFATPYFRCYDAGQFNKCICRDFEPAPIWKYLYGHWKGFDDYYQGFDDYDRSLFFGKPLAFIIDGNKSVRYYVKSTDFINGTMFNQDGALRWIYKQYYVATRKNSYGYQLVREYPDVVIKEE